MLGERTTREIIDQLWDSLACEVALPEGEEEYFRGRRPSPMVYEERRRFPRFTFRQRAVLEHDGKRFAIYTKDISRGGLLLVHAEQLYPCDRVAVRLGNGKRLLLTIRWCHRVAERCYECGGAHEKGSPEEPRAAGS